MCCKNIRKLSFFLFIFSFFVTNAQEVLDGVYPKESTSTRKVVPLQEVREVDVMWKKRIWRSIDVAEKFNQRLYYPLQSIQDHKSFFEIVRNGISEGTLSLYEDDGFAVKMTKQQAMQNFSYTLELVVPDENGDNITKPKEYKEYTTEDLLSVELKEEWFVDRKRSIMDVRIIGFSLVMKSYDPTTGQIRDGFSRTGWVYFPEARFVLINYEVFNPNNDAGRITYDDLLRMRLFSSMIVKENNVQDRTIASYNTGVSRLLEAEEIAEKIFNFEHDLWQY